MICSPTFDLLRSRLSLSPSGSLSLNGQEMILLPRHFFRYLLREIKNVAGANALNSILRKAGFDGAITFCERFMTIHACTPREALEAYLNEMSLRGWGQFKITSIDPNSGLLEVCLEKSALAAEGDLPSGNVIWEGAVLGAMTFLLGNVEGAAKMDLKSHSEELRTPNSSTLRLLITVSPKSEEK